MYHVDVHLSQLYYIWDLRTEIREDKQMLHQMIHRKLECWWYLTTLVADEIPHSVFSTVVHILLRKAHLNIYGHLLCCILQDHTRLRIFISTFPSFIPTWESQCPTCSTHFQHLNSLLSHTHVDFVFKSVTTTCSRCILDQLSLPYDHLMFLQVQFVILIISWHWNTYVDIYTKSINFLSNLVLCLYACMRNTIFWLLHQPTCSVQWLFADFAGRATLATLQEYVLEIVGNDQICLDEL